MNEDLTYQITFSKLMVLLIAVGILSGVAVFWLLYSFVFPYNAPVVLDPTLQGPTRPVITTDTIPSPVENSKARVFVQPARGGDYILPQNIISSAFAITSDGWFITSFPASYEAQFHSLLPSLRVIDDKNHIGEINEYLYDEATGFYFIKTTLQGLSSMDISFESVMPEGEIVGVECSDNRFFVRYLGGARPEYAGRSDAVLSSEVLNRTIRIQPTIELTPGCILYDHSQQMLGMAVERDGIAKLVPGYHIAAHITSILREGSINRPYMGVSYLDLFDVVPVDMEWANNDAAAVLYGVNAVRRNSPAEKSGLQAGDVIDRINNEKISVFKDLAEIVQEYSSGDTLTIVFTRDGERMETTLTLE